MTLSPDRAAAYQAALAAADTARPQTPDEITAHIAALLANAAEGDA